MSDWTPESESEGNASFSLVWRFIDQSPTFARGIAVGIVYERMSRREAVIDATTHAELEEEYRNLANSLEYRASFEPLGEDGYWQAARFTRA